VDQLARRRLEPRPNDDQSPDREDAPADRRQLSPALVASLFGNDARTVTSICAGSTRKVSSIQANHSEIPNRSNRGCGEDPSRRRHFDRERLGRLTGVERGRIALREMDQRVGASARLAVRLS
jgi:hypothetical protein